MSISKSPFNYHKKDEGCHFEDYDYGSNLKKKQKRDEDEEEEGEEIRMDDLHVSLPIELILEFLSRLPVKSLTRLSCASKYLYNTINQNQQFTKSHFINYSQKNPFLVFYINYYYGTGKEQQQWLFKSFFHTSRDIKDDGNDNYNVHLSKTFMEKESGDFVGYCNGLICFVKTTTEIAFVIDVWNSTTRELLRIVPPVSRGGRYKLMSCGFGFDSINNEYKLVIIVFMFQTKSLKCLLYTFGIKSSWTEVRSPDSGLLRTSPSATFTSGALFWLTTDLHHILMFDLHEDKLQYIRIPVERSLDTRLFEYKGCLVVAVLQKKSPPALGVDTTTTLTLEKIHLKILKAYKDNQVWVEETIDLSKYAISFSPNFRFVSFSDQILLYWVDLESFQFFNLHRKCLKVVRNLAFRGSEKRLPPVVRAEDYWLNCEVKNICSLKTLLPERAQNTDRDAINAMMTKSLDMWTLHQQKTVGGIFTSYYRSKTSQHYFFDD